MARRRLPVDAPGPRCRIGRGPLTLEAELSQRFGFEWQYREASKGRVIAGIPDRVIRAFSARRETINARTAQLVDAYRAAHKGADPSRYQLHSMRQYATQVARPGKPEGLIDWHAQLRAWEAKSRAHELGALTDLARAFWRAGHPAQVTREAASRNPAR